MTTMKGFLKGLKYISQIFETEKEQEIEIGFPTDVKHVAHIGWDSPSANKPSWMKDYKGTPEVSSMSSNGEVKASTKSSIKDPSVDSPTRHSSSKTKQSRRVHSSTNSVDSPTRDPNKPRRHKNSGSLDSPTQKSTKRAMRIQNSNVELESLSLDPPKVPKQSRGKTSKGSSGVGSNRSSRSKGPSPLTGNFQCSDPESEQGLNNNGLCPNSVLEVHEEGKECDEISRGNHAL